MEILKNKNNSIESQVLKEFEKEEFENSYIEKNSFNVTMTTSNINGTITGKVLDSSNRPIEGAVVKLMDGTFKSLSNTITDNNGEYYITSIPYSNIYNMMAIAKGKLPSRLEQFTLLSGENKIINFTLQLDTNTTLGTISGIINDINSNAISETTILLYSVINGSNSLLSVTNTDNLGIFLFTELNPGKYYIVISASGYIQEKETIIVEGGIITSISKVLNINVNIDSGIVSGIITDTSQKPISGTNVLLYNESNFNPLNITRTNSSGMYMFFDVPTGNYLIKSSQIDLGSITLSTIPTTTIATYPFTITTSSGILSQGASPILNNSFVYNIGDSGGYITLIFKALTKGSHTLDIQYLSGDKDRSFYIDINGVSTGTIYLASKTIDWTIANAKTITTVVNLDENLNTIKLYNNFEPAPWIGSLIVAPSTSPVIPPSTVPTIPVITYPYSINATKGTFSSGAYAVLNNTFVANIGSTGGLVTVIVKALFKGSHTLDIQYLSGDKDRSFYMDINGVFTGTVYLATKTVDWTIANAKKVTTIIDLNVDLNIIKLYHISNTPSPWIGNLTINTSTIPAVPSTTIPTPPVITYPYTINATKGILSIGASSILNNTFVANIVGTSVYVIVPFKGLEKGNYNLSIQYISGDKDRILKIDVNGIFTGTLYKATKTMSWAVASSKTINTIISLNTELNTIKLYSEHNTVAPWVGNLTVTPSTLPVIPPSTLPTTPDLTFPYTINATRGIFSAGVSTILNNTFLANIGGTGGYVLVPFTISTKGSYTLTIQYISGDKDRSFLLDVNGISTQIVYTATKTLNWMAINAKTIRTVVNLNAKLNTIKFYNNVNIPSPWIGNLILNPN